MLKNNKGITLVALVVTIVILLILAGVSLNLVLGDNGIVRKAQGGKRKNRRSRCKRQGRTCNSRISTGIRWSIF